MIWPFRRRFELRQQARAITPGGGSYTDAIVQAILNVAAAAPGTPTPLATAAVEACAQLYASAFASARVIGGAGAVRAATLAAIARDLIRHGESVHVIHASGMMGAPLRLLQAESWDVHGGYDPDTWRYQVSIAAPSGAAFNRRLPAGEIVHAMYARSGARPWTGVSPLVWASASGGLLAAVERVLADESSGTRGYVLPMPGGAVARDDDAEGDDAVERLKADLRSLSGRTALVETTAGGFGTGASEAPRSDWQPRRIGPDFPQSVVQLRHDASAAVTAACGVPQALVQGRGDSSALREAWRVFLHGSVAPLARCVEQELSAKLERTITLDFTALWAADVQGRARAFKSLVDGGMDIERAAAATGV